MGGPERTSRGLAGDPADRAMRAVRAALGGAAIGADGSTRAGETAAYAPTRPIALRGMSADSCAAPVASPVVIGDGLNPLTIR